jgi:hypothetical protein
MFELLNFLVVIGAGDIEKARRGVLALSKNMVAKPASESVSAS